MRSRAFAPVVLLTLIVLLGACGPLPSLPAPTAAPVTTASAVTPEAVATGSAPVTNTLTVPITPTLPVSPAAAVSPTVALSTTVPLTQTAALTPTAELPAQPVLTPEVTAAAPVTQTQSAGKPQEGGMATAMSTYRDSQAGFEIDYPASWPVVEVSQAIRDQSQSYSVTFMSWQDQQPGGQGVPAGGSKIDVTVTKGGAETPQAAVESRRQELLAEGAGSQVTFEEPWDLPGGLSGAHWTIQTVQGETIQELITAINGNRIVVSGLGDADQFAEVAMTLRPVGTTLDNADVSAPLAAQGVETPAAPAAARSVETPAPESTQGQAAPAASPEAGNAALSQAQPSATTVYTVRQGDTLAKIAARFGVTTAAILRANPQITNPDRIYIGQRLNIPASGGTQPPPPATTRVNIYMIGLNGGSVGCGDQVVPVRRDVPRTAAPLTAALNLLLAQKSQYYGESGLYNALYQSNLRIASITRSGSAWTIRLTGTLRLGGVCDNPRVKAQLDQTALQFPTVGTVRYFVNGQPLETLLSGK